MSSGLVLKAGPDRAPDPDFGPDQDRHRGLGAIVEAGALAVNAI